MYSLFGDKLFLVVSISLKEKLMRKEILCVAICSSLIFSVYANTHSGKCEFGKETVNDIFCYGPAILTDTTVKGHVAIAGPIEANNTIMASMQAIGVANLSNASVKSNVTVAGPLNSKHGTFEGDLMITSDKSVLNDSTVQGSITVKSEENAPVLELICGTKISGGVIFDGKPGIIKKSSDSVISGKVKNGKIETFLSKQKCEKKKTAEVPVIHDEV